MKSPSVLLVLASLLATLYALGCSGESAGPKDPEDAGPMATRDGGHRQLTDSPEPPTSPDGGASQETSLAPDAPAEDGGASDPDPPPEDRWFTSGDGCVEPTDYVTAACEVVDCVETTTCMGDGHCVPSAPFGGAGGASGESQLKPALALGGDGGFAVAWHAFTDGSPQVTRVYFQRFLPNGTPAGDATRVDDDHFPVSRSPSITRTEAGGFFVVWREESALGEVRTMGQIIGADGVPGPGPLQLNSTPLELSLVPGNVDSPFASLLRTGDLAVTWSADPADPEAQSDVYLRVLGSDGTLQGDELPTGGATTANETSSVVTDTWDGGVAIFWHEQGNGILEGVVRGRLFNQQGGPKGEVFTASPQVDSYEGLPSATTFPEGEILLSWRVQQGTSSADPMDVRTRLLDAQGLAIEDTAQTVWTSSSGYAPFYAPIELSGSSRAVFAWHTSDEAVDSVFVRRYLHPEGLLDCSITDAAGPLGVGELGGRHLPALLGFPDGRILVAWSSLFEVDGQPSSYRVVFRYLK